MSDKEEQDDQTSRRAFLPTIGKLSNTNENGDPFEATADGQMKDQQLLKSNDLSHDTIEKPQSRNGLDAKPRNSDATSMFASQQAPDTNTQS